PPIMKMVTNSEASSRLAAANGPPPANVPQTAKPARMSTAVAVSRGAAYSTPHSSGTTARKANALRPRGGSRSGLKARSPTRMAAMQTPTGTRILSGMRMSRMRLRTSSPAQSTMTGATTSTPATSRPHHATHKETASDQSAYPAKHRLLTPTVAPNIALGPSPTKANFAIPAGVSNVLRPPAQMSVR